MNVVNPSNRVDTDRHDQFDSGFQDNDIKRMKYLLEKLKSNNNKTRYEQVNDLENKQYEFNCLKGLSDLKQSLGCFGVDLDLLSDSMAVQTCYVLSRSMNLEQNIRDDLELYYQCSLAVLFISMLPRLNCYLFYILRTIASRTKMIRKEGDGEQLVYERKSCFRRLFIETYRLIARFYGINYDSSNEDRFSC